ncbi:hypothetical protein [Shiella aurantiaca]|uniref:hypothetical protein n=1 Tax=Shiella aurantiaca TaxID=3058365 RepID=UPI0029F5BC1E|nr:hypothetical protein [Shiella aurantiaca]
MTRRFFLVCICLSGLFLGNKALASSESDSVDFHLLSLEYRLYTEELSVDERNTLLMQKATLFHQSNRLSEAIETLLRGNLYGGNDSIRSAVYTRLAYYNYLLKDYKKTQSYLLENAYYFEGTYLANQNLYLEILTHLQLQEWEEAKEKFNRFAALYTLNYEDARYFETHPLPRLKDSEKAVSISHYLPGIGQWYAGYPGKALVSGGIQAAFVGFGLYNFYTGYFFSGAFTGIGLFYTFYTGGARHAGYLAEQTNAKRLTEFNEPLSRIIVESVQQKSIKKGK